MDPRTHLVALYAVFTAITGCSKTDESASTVVLEPSGLKVVTGNTKWRDPMLQKLLQERIARAKQYQVKDNFLYDPIQDDPALGPLIQKAQAEAAATAKQRGMNGMGTVHFIWGETARILKERHSLTWFSPAEMNPDVMFD